MSEHEKIEAIRQDRDASHKRLLELGSEAYRAFLGLERAAFADVVEAIGVVRIEMGGGPATAAARFALKALAYHTRPLPGTPERG